MKVLRVATCQFPVEADITANHRHVVALMKKSESLGADVVHFSECALSGYAGVDIPGTVAIEWDALVDATQDIQQLAKRTGQWVFLGSTHRLSGGNRPHNSVYVIDSRGRIVGRYDKRFCTGRGGKRPTLDLRHYSPGQRTTVVKIKGVRCAPLICYDYRFPELYRELKQKKSTSFYSRFTTPVERSSTTNSTISGNGLFPPRWAAGPRKTTSGSARITVRRGPPAGAAFRCVRTGPSFGSFPYTERASS